MFGIFFSIFLGTHFFFKHERFEGLRIATLNWSSEKSKVTFSSIESCLIAYKNLLNMRRRRKNKSMFLQELLNDFCDEFFKQSGRELKKGKVGKLFENFPKNLLNEFLLGDLFGQFW